MGASVRPVPARRLSAPISDAEWNAPAPAPAPAPTAPPAPPRAAAPISDAEWGDPPAERPGVLARARDVLWRAVTHPLETLTAPLAAAGDLIAPDVEGARQLNDPGSLFQQRMRARLGTNVAVRGVTGRERAGAAVQTAVNLVAPELLGGAGSLATRLGGGPLARGAAQGATAAGIGAALNPEDPGAGAFVGLGTFGLGAAAAKGVQGVGRLAGAAADARAVPRPVREVRAVLRTALEADGLNEASLRAAAAAAPPDAILLDLGGRATKAQGYVAATTPGSRGRAVLERALLGRQEAEGPALRAAAEQAAGMRAPNPTQHLKALRAAQRAAADPLYAAGIAEGDALHPQGVESPVLRDILDTPFGKEAWKAALKSAAQQRRPLPQAFREEVVPVPSGMLDHRGQPLVETRLVPTDTRPDMRAVQAVKIKLQAIYEREMAKGTLDQMDAATLAQQIGALNDELRTLAPKYKHADDVFAEHQRGIDAFTQGRQDGNARADVVEENLANLPDAARGQYRAGQLARTADRIGSPQQGHDVAGRLRSPNRRAQQAAWMPDAPILDAAADLWRTRRLTIRRVLGGLATSESENTAARAANRGRSGAAGRGPVQSLLQRQPGRAAAQVVDRLTGGALERRALRADAARNDVLADYLAARVAPANTGGHAGDPLVDVFGRPRLPAPPVLDAPAFRAALAAALASRDERRPAPR